MKALTTRPGREARAEALFALYYQAGPMRSLESLSAILTRIGVRVSLTTLKTYSGEYGWHARVLALDEQDAADETTAIRVIDRMNTRQAAIGRVGLDIAAKALGLVNEEDRIFLDPVAAIKLARDAQHIERLAMGEATSRSEIAIKVYSELLIQIEALFLDVNKMDGAAERERRFRIGVDSLVEAHASGATAEMRVIDADAGGTAPAPTP